MYLVALCYLEKQPCFGGQSVQKIYSIVINLSSPSFGAQINSVSRKQGKFSKAGNLNAEMKVAYEQQANEEEYFQEKEGTSSWHQQVEMEHIKLLCRRKNMRRRAHWVKVNITPGMFFDELYHCNMVESSKHVFSVTWGHLKVLKRRCLHTCFHKNINKSIIAQSLKGKLKVQLAQAKTNLCAFFALLIFRVREAALDTTVATEWNKWET